MTRRLQNLVLGMGWVLAMAITGLANVPPPPPSPGAPPLPGAKPAAEVRSEKLLFPVQVRRADLSGEGDGVQAKIVLPARLRDLPPPAGAPGKVGALEHAPRSLIAAVALSLAAVSVVLVIRGKNLTTTAKAAILSVAAVPAVFGAAQANAPAPPRLAKEIELKKAKIVIEFSADVTEAVLTLPK